MRRGRRRRVLLLLLLLLLRVRRRWLLAIQIRSLLLLLLLLCRLLSRLCCLGLEGVPGARLARWGLRLLLTRLLLTRLLLLPLWSLRQRHRDTHLWANLTLLLLLHQPACNGLG